MVFRCAQAPFFAFARGWHGDFLPDEMELKLLENVDNPGGPLGSKAVGEPPFMYGIAAFFAIRRAIEAFEF